jgi:hypothetical protein
VLQSMKTIKMKIEIVHEKILLFQRWDVTARSDMRDLNIESEDLYACPCDYVTICSEFLSFQFSGKLQFHTLNL